MHTLSRAAVPEDELGNAYEYLVKQFADDSGHTAQEFYTNRDAGPPDDPDAPAADGRPYLRSDGGHGRHAHLRAGGGAAQRR